MHGPSPSTHGKDGDGRRGDGADELSAFDRALLLVAGWLLVLLGIAGLVLPILQGILFLLLGGAVLSLVSTTAFGVLRWAFQRWPKGWKRLLHYRRAVVRRITGASDHGNPIWHRLALVAIVVVVVGVPLALLPLACDAGQEETSRFSESTSSPAGERPAVDGDGSGLSGP